MVDLTEMIKQKFKPKSGYSVHISHKDGKGYAAVFQAKEIKGRYNTKDTTYISVGNFSGTDEKQYKEFLMNYLEKR